MKRALLLIAIFNSFLSNAQNYQCLQSGVRHYFKNSNGYLRGMRIDSVRMQGDTTIYYPFHTPRGRWGFMLGGIFTELDSNGGSWLGKKVLQLADGTFVFDRLWGGSVKLLPQANIGDSWIFYQDTTGLNYKATISLVDTMSFLGVLDSVKTIVINTYQDTIPLLTDSINGLQIILSKNYGFVQVLDLYTFPYHPVDSAFELGRDLFMDESLYKPFGNYDPPYRGNTIFKLTSFINPVSNELYGSNVGDVYQTAHFYGSSWPAISFILDTVATKSIFLHGVSYTKTGVSGDLILPSPSPAYTISNYSSGFNTNDSTYLFNTTQMPEEQAPGYSFSCKYYLPDDSSYCTPSPEYIVGSVLFEGKAYTYKTGFGKIEYLWWTDEVYWDDKLIFAQKAGVTCGTPESFPNSVPVVTAQNTLSLYPNPAKETLTIQSSNLPIEEIIIINTLGQTVYSTQCHEYVLEVGVTQLQAGIYFVKINGVNVKKFAKR